MRDLRSPYPVLRALCPAVRISPCRYLPVCRRRSCWGVRPVRPLRGPTNREPGRRCRYTGAGYTLRRCGLRLRSHAVRRRRTVWISRRVLLNIFCMKFSCMPPQNPRARSTRHRPVLRHLEITAVVVDRQRGPVLEQVLVGGVTEREGSGELRFERQFFGVDLVGIGVQLFRNLPYNFPTVRGEAPLR